MKQQLWLRIVTPIVAIGTVIALLTFERPLILPKSNVPFDSVPVSVSPADLQLVCPGALLRVGGTDGTDPDLRERIGEAELSFGSASQSSILLNGESIQLSSYSSSRSLNSSAIIEFATDGVEQGSVQLTGSQAQSVAVERMQGLASSGCIQPAAEAWFVAGSTEPGAETLLIIVNPSAIASTVTVNAHSATGATRSDQLVLPAGETRLYPVDKLVNGEGEFTIQVATSQGKIAAFLQQRQTSGLSALGVDLVTPASAAATELVVPGILVRGSELREQGVIGNWLRVFNPRDEAVELLIEVVGSSTAEYGGVLTATVSANNTVDIPLAGLPDGNYAAFVTASAPVMAGALSEGAVTIEAVDIAWSQSAVQIGETFAFAVPQASLGLQLTNPSSQSITVSLKQGAQAIAHSIPAKSTRYFPVQQGFLLVESSQSDLVANLIADSSLGFGVIALGSNQNFGSQIEVKVRR